MVRRVGVPLDESEHEVRVDDWLTRTVASSSNSELASSFQDVFTRLWKRANRTLGDVTLAAIVDRVLYNAAKRFEVLKSLKVERASVRFDEFEERSLGIPFGDLRVAVCHVLVEFLSVLDTLTAGVLTPALHAELAERPKVISVPRARRSGEGNS